MSDTTTPGTANSGAGSALSLPQAVQMMAERRAARASSAPENATETPEPASAVFQPPDQTSDQTSDQPAEPAPEPAPNAELPPSSPEALPDDAGDETATISVDGVQLTTAEIRRGYMRQADYSRKTQSLSHATRQVDAERAVKLTRLDQLADALEAVQAPEPDWVAVARANPHGWVQQKTQWDNHRTAVENARRMSAAVRADTISRDKRLMAMDLARSYNHSWQDPRAMERDFRSIAHYAAAQGYTADEIDSVSQARHLVTLDKARRWDELQSSRPEIAKRLATKPQVQRPGAKPSVAAHQRSMSAAWEKFLKNPTVENGASYQRVKREASAQRRSFE